MSAEAAPRKYDRYHIGTPGQKWGDSERAAWLGQMKKQRDYFTEVVSPLMRIGRPDAEVFQYGELDYRHRTTDAARYPLFAVKSSPWVKEQPLVLVTGGVHGYETSGVQGALLFAQKHMQHYATTKKLNVLILPCVSPWGYEHIQRWTPDAVDPNRQFDPSNPGCSEAAQAMKCIAEYVQNSASVWVHTDLHETTDTDNSEFTPAKAARDGAEPEEWSEVPDGYYCVGDAARPAPEFQAAIIAEVEKITHIALPDEKGEIIGVPISQRGVINYPGVGLCGNHTKATYVVTTEVYPDSKKTTPEECNRAQAACIIGAVEYALAHPPSSQ